MTGNLRRQHRGLALVTMLAVVVLLASAAGAESGGDGRHIVVFKPWFTDKVQQQAVIHAAGGHANRALAIVNGIAAELPPGIAKQLARRGDVERVEVDAVVHALGGKKPPKPKPPPQQPAEQLAWGVDRIDAEWAWATARGAGVRVAVIDTGIDKDHPDLAANVAGGVNFVRKGRKPANSSAWDDDNGHGTHVAGIIAAADNDIGVLGAAPEASLYAVKVLDKRGSGYVSDVIAGIEWAVANGMDVANMSLGGDGDVQSLREACDAAAEAGLLLVAAAGNDGGAVDYPAAYPSVIAVAATDAADAVPSWSSRGPEVALAAPGVDVFSTWKGGGYAVESGTSMAAPHVAGTLALALSAGVGSDLCSAADDLPPAGIDAVSGCGLVDAGETVTGVLNYGDDLP